MTRHTILSIIFFILIVILTVFLYPLSIIFITLLLLIFLLIKILKNKYIKNLLFSIMVFILAGFIIVAAIYLKISINLNRELTDSGFKKMPVSAIFFNDFYKYIGKENKVIFFNKKYDYVPNRKYIDKKVNKEGETIIDAEYNIDEYGYRYCKGNKDAMETYAFFGCSLVFGIGLNDNETLPFYFSQLLNFNSNVVNSAFPGGGIHTSLEEINSERFKKVVKNKQIKYIFYNFTSDHSFRSFVGRFQNNVFRKKYNKLQKTRKNIFLNSKMFDTIMFDKTTVFLFNLLYKKKMDDLLISLIEEMNKICKEEYNAEFILFSYDENIEKFIRKLAIKGIDCIKIKFDYPSKPNGYYNIIGDGHPTKNANKEAADILYSYIRKNL